MSLGHIPLESITESDLQGLIDNKVPEGKRIEYKGNPPAIKDSEKKDLLIDVSSFANATGGDLIYGIREEDHIPVEVAGISIENIDMEKQRLANIIRDGFEPRIWGINIHIIPLSSGKKVIIIRIPRSYNPPHMVTYGGERRFYSRGPAGKYPLDVSELRLLFGLTDATAKRIRDFRADRLMKIKNGEAPVLMLKGPTYVLHMIPFDAFSLGSNYDLSAFDQLRASTLPNISNVCSEMSTGRLNFDGFVSYPGYVGNIVPTLERPARSYTQLFRNGIVESAHVQYNPTVNGQVEKNINPSYETRIVQGIKKFLNVQTQLGVSPPTAVLLAILGVKGRSISKENSDDGLWAAIPFEQDDLVLSEMVLENLEDDISKKMRPIFDIVLNAAGLKGGN
jgi:hypothetical protein